MKKYGVQAIIAMARDPKREGELYDLAKACFGNGPVTATSSKNEDRHANIERALEAVSVVLQSALRFTNPLEGDAGHGPGHWCRDFIHALRLAHDEEIPVSDVVPGIVGGTLHDMGTLFVDRYADKNRAVRHAEIGALIVRAALMESGPLAQSEIDTCAYAIAAHTHYLKPSEAKCADGVVRKIDQYVDMVADRPLLSVYLTRWADRLDCSGPCMVGRHYLTMHRDHTDFGKDGFYKVSLRDHVRPVQRTDEVIKAGGGQRTMVEHLRMFASSQSNTSPYGKYDFGMMRYLRDEYRASLDHILDRVLHPTDVDVERVNRAWTLFLGSNIEPSEMGRSAAHDLSRSFATLDPAAQRAWACGFRTTMTEYLGWADRAVSFLNTLPSSHLRIAKVFPDVRDVIRPNLTWVGMLAT